MMRGNYHNFEMYLKSNLSNPNCYNPSAGYLNNFYLTIANIDTVAENKNFIFVKFGSMKCDY